MRLIELKIARANK